MSYHWQLRDWMCLVLLIGGIVSFLGLICRVIAKDAAERQQDIAGGCICKSGAIIRWERSDCPVHGNRSKKRPVTQSDRR